VVRIHPLLGNGPISTHARTTEEKCFPWGPCRGIIRKSNSEASGCRSTTEYKGVQRRTRMERVLGSQGFAEDLL
jgi:hypothetical protein